MAKHAKLTDLVADSKNFNKGTTEGNALLEKSIQRFGFREAATLDKNGVLIGGNKRTAKAGELGFEDVEIIKASSKKVYALQYDDIDIETTEGRELALALNATAKANIIFDVELIEAELGEVICQEWGIELSGKDDAQEDEFVIPDDVKTSIKVGDLIEIGPHKLLCGDSTLKKTFATLFGDKLADMVLTDPPYNVSYVGKTKKKLTIDNDKQTDNDFYKFLEIVNFSTAFIKAGIKLAQMIIWEKNSMVMGRKDYHFKHEPCLYGWKEGAAHKWYGDRTQTTILKFDRPSRSGKHPTMKPVPLFAYQIGNSSKQGDIVADPFGGSGTTMVACHQMNRKAYLVENDPVYCQVIILRMLALDPTVIVKVNGKPYKEGGASVKTK